MKTLNVALLFVCVLLITSSVKIYSLDELILTPELVTLTKQIDVGYTDAHNPSIVKFGNGFLVSFRYPPIYKYLWHNQIGVIFLNEALEPISKPQLLNLPIQGTVDDAKLFPYGDKIYLIFGVLPLCTPTHSDLSIQQEYLAEIKYQNGNFIVGQPLRLSYNKSRQNREKNWTPFDNEGVLFMSYYPVPQEVLHPNLESGECLFFCDASTHLKNAWPWGELRGGSPAYLVDDFYLAFFHSSTSLRTYASEGHLKPHYFTGAYTFSSKPPFEILKISPKPIIAQGMYGITWHPWVTIFVGGYVVVGDDVYVAYGRNDSEVWVAKMPKDALLHSLVPVESLLGNH